MRKLIIITLILTMLCCTFGCGKKEAETSAPAASSAAENLLLTQATVLAQQLGTAVDSSYLQFVGITNQAASEAQFFTIAASPANLASAAFLPLNGRDLPEIIHNLNAEYNTSGQLACTSLLQFTTQFYVSEEISENIALHMLYGAQCHIVVFFEPQGNQLVKATVYPMFPKAGQSLMALHFSNAKGINKQEIQEILGQVGKVSCAATPTGSNNNASYYVDLAKSVLAEVEPVSNEVLKQYTSDSAVLSQASMFISALSGEAVSGKVYRFPANAETGMPKFPSKVVQHLAKQKLYLSFTNRIGISFGDACMAANTITQEVISTRSPGVVATKNESPVLVLLDFGDVTVLVALYPNEYNTYLYSITCLPCDFSQAGSLLTARGALLFQ